MTKKKKNEQIQSWFVIFDCSLPASFLPASVDGLKTFFFLKQVDHRVLSFASRWRCWYPENSDKPHFWGTAGPRISIGLKCGRSFEDRIESSIQKAKPPSNLEQGKISHLKKQNKTKQEPIPYQTWKHSKNYLKQTKQKVSLIACGIKAGKAVF